MRFKELGKSYLLYVVFITSVLSFLFIFADAQPSWLKEGVYAVYKFKCAYALKSQGSDGYVELYSVGGGYYRWEVVEVNGKLVVLNVTLKTGNLVRSVLVTIDSETMDLLEDGKVWGKAWLWIDLTKHPAPQSYTTIIRNVTLIVRWLNGTVKNPKFSRIYSISKETFLKPLKTGLGIVDECVTVSVITNVKYVRIEGKGMSFSPGPRLGLSWYYETKCGIFYAGSYIDDILTQKFGVFYFEHMSRVHEPGYWMILEDTNLEIGVIREYGMDFLSALKGYYIYILLGVLATLFVVAFLRGRVWSRP